MPWNKIVTNSEMQNFQRCRRKWWLRNYRQLRAPEGAHSPQNVGSFVHDALEAYYDPENGAFPAHAILAQARKLIDANPMHAEQLAKDAELASIMVEGYMEWLDESGADDGLDVFAAEEGVDMPLGKTGYTLRGKLDARAYRRHDGSRVFLEHKTVANLADQPKLAQIQPQFLTYHLLEFLKAKEEGDESRSDGLVINMLRRVKRTARANPPFYGRHEVRYNTEEIRAHWKHVVEIARQIDAVRARLDEGEDHHKVVPPTVEKDCAWKCDFYHVCPHFDDGSRIEDFLADQYVEEDHMARYAPEGDEE